MNTPHAGLRIFRHQLRDAVQHDLDRARRGRVTRRAVRGGAAVLAVTAGVAAAMIVPGGAGVPPANAALLHAVATALTPPPGTILHEQATVTVDLQVPQTYEYEHWVQTDSPYAFRTIKFGCEFSGDGTRFSDYNAGTNTITASPDPGPYQVVDLAASLRSLIQAGQARLVGSTTVNGVPAYELQVTRPTPGWSNNNGVAGGTYDVAQSDYHPLLVKASADCFSSVCGETIAFQTYEYLPATAANLALLDLSAQHPGARIGSASPTPAC